MIKRTLFFSNPAYLSMENSQIAIKSIINDNNNNDASYKKDLVRTIPIEDIGIIVLENRQITLTTGLIAALVDNNAAIITCDKRCMPTGMILPLTGNTVQNERFRAQLDASLPLKKQLWQQTISMKISNQAKNLKLNTNVECGCMEAWSKDVRSGDPMNLEARAAAYYWKNLFPSFPNFIRDREGDYPNNMLNYGYAILRAVIARSLVGSGLLPTLGIHHQNRYNAYCLADDIMEPYRPFVDQLVIRLMDEYLRIVDLTKEIKAKLLTIPTLDVKINGKRSPLMIAATMTTASLAKCFNGESRKIDYPEL